MAKPTKLREKWRIRWIDHLGVRKSAVYCDYRTASNALKLREAESYNRKSGLMPLPASKCTFLELAELWLSNRASNKKSGHHDRSILQRHLVPAFGSYSIADVRPSHIDGFCSSNAHLSPKTIHNILTLAISMFNYAKDEGLLTSIPKIRKPKIKIADEDYTYLRTKDEAERFLAAALSVDADAHDLYAVALHTGMRAGELANLKFKDIDFERNLIHVVGSFGGTTKSGSSRVVPLLPGIQKILRMRRATAISDYVFVNKLGNPLKPSARIFQETLHRVLDHGHFPRPGAGRQRHYITFHDLRHTFASHWMMDGLDLFKLQRILGHEDTKMTMRYSHLSHEAFALDLSKAANFTRTLSAKVTSIHNPESERNSVQVPALKHAT